WWNGVVIERTQFPEGSPKKGENNPDQERASREGDKNRGRNGHQGAPEVAAHQNTRSSVHKQIPRARDGGLRQDGIGRAGMVLSDIIIFLMVAGLLGGLIYVMASPNRYAKMTDEEFEEDTKRGSVLGSVVIGMERALRRREADLVI